MAKIMVIDDSATIRHLTKKILENSGHEVVCESSSVTLPLRLQSEQPDLVLLDVSMPLLTGDRSIAVLRDRGIQVSGLLILYSSKPKEELKSIAEKCGADGFIHKSVGQTEFMRRITDYLELGRSGT